MGFIFVRCKIHEHLWIRILILAGLRVRFFRWGLDHIDIDCW